MPLHPSNSQTLTGASIIRSRLPNREWFTVDQAADALGWGRTFIRTLIENGKLEAMEDKKQNPHRCGRRNDWKIHREYLVAFLLDHSRGAYTDAKIAATAAKIIRAWPKYYQRLLLGQLSGHLDRHSINQRRPES